MVGPGSTLGEIEWGTASDGQRIYVAITNNLHDAHKLANGGETITWGSWIALNARTGRIVWQTADPTKGAIDMGAVERGERSHVRGVVLGIDERSGCQDGEESLQLR